MNRVWLGILLSLAGFFTGLSWLVHTRALVEFDRTVLFTLQATLPRIVDLPFSWLSVLGSAEITSAIFLALVFFLAPPAQRVPFILAFGAMTFLELLGKSFLRQPTVPYEWVRTIRLATIPSGDIPTFFAYPSGHSARTVFLAVLCAGLIAPRNLARAPRRAIYLALGALVGAMLLSRPYLAEHWTTDVIGGALLGTLFALLPFTFPKIAGARNLNERN